MHDHGIIVTWLYWMLLPVSLFAQEVDEPYTLGEVVVTADGPVVEDVGMVRQVTAQELEERKVRTLQEAIELLPGIDIRTATDGVARVDVRGFRSRHVLLLVDGIPYNSTFDGQFDPTLLPVENIAKIKVSYGNHSVLYGPGGLGGVINVVTKKGAPGLHGFLSGEAGSGDRYLGRAGLSGANDTLDFLLTGSLLDAQGYELADSFSLTPVEGGGIRENSDRERGTLTAHVGYAPIEEVDLGLVLTWGDMEYGKPPITIDDRDDIYASRPKYVRLEDQEWFSGQLSGAVDLPGPFELSGALYLNTRSELERQYEDDHYDSMDDPTIKGTYSLDADTSIFGGTAQAAVDLERAGTLTFSGRAEEHTYDVDGFIRDLEVETAEKGGGKKGQPKLYDWRSIDDDRSVELASLAIEYELEPIEHTGIVLGYGHHWFEGDDGASEDDGTFLVGLHVDLWERTRLRGSFARRVRFPSIRQLYEEEAGNPELGPETSRNWELGLDQGFGEAAQVSVTGFVIDAEDYIEKTPPLDIFLNNDEYRFRGLEITTEITCIPHLMLRGGCTLMDTEDRSSGTEREELQYRPELKVTVEGTYTTDFGLRVHADLMHVADQYYYSRKTPLEKAKLNDYTVVNFNVDQSCFDGKLRAFLGVDNLFDREYEESYGFPREGRAIRGGLKLRW
jgi:outer membrane cobalamin receptor